MTYNPYRKLLGLLPTYPLQVGTVVVASPSTGKVVVQLPGGGRLTARGEGSVGANVFVRDGVVEGPAPSLTIEVIEVGT